MMSLTGLVFLLGLSVASCVQFTTVYEWEFKEMDYAWPSEANKTKALEHSNFIPKALQPRFLAVYKERIFLSFLGTIGVPVTLASLPTSSSASPAPPKLTPFPSWGLNGLESCDAVNNAKGLEVDADGRLWVVDNGRWECKAKLWIFNLANNDAAELVHYFPQEVVTANFYGRSLLDLVLDKSADDTIALIADLDNERVVAFSRKRNESWAVKTPGLTFSCLALSPREESRQVYLVRGHTRELYSLPVAELRAKAESAAPKLVGEWSELPVRVLVSNAGVLYAAFFTTNRISTWNTLRPFSEQRFHQFGPLGDAGWSFTFALDAAGTLWLSQRNETGNKPSHKLLKTALGAKSYLHGVSSG